MKTSKQENKENFESVNYERLLKRYDDLIKVLISQTNLRVSKNQGSQEYHHAGVHRHTNHHDHDRLSESLDVREERSPVKIVNKSQRTAAVGSLKCFFD